MIDPKAIEFREFPAKDKGPNVTQLCCRLVWQGDVHLDNELDKQSDGNICRLAKQALVGDIIDACYGELEKDLLEIKKELLTPVGYYLPERFKGETLDIVNRALERIQALR